MTFNAPMTAAFIKHNEIHFFSEQLAIGTLPENNLRFYVVCAHRKESFFNQKITEATTGTHFDHIAAADLLTRFHKKPHNRCLFLCIENSALQKLTRFSHEQAKSN